MRGAWALAPAFLSAALLAQAPTPAPAAATPAPPERGTLHLFADGAPAGEETYELVRDGARVVLTASMKAEASGKALRRDATLEMGPDFAPRLLKLTRRPEPDLVVEVGGLTATVRSGRTRKKLRVGAPTFAMSGAAPVSVVGMLVRFSQRKALRDLIPVLPAGLARVELRGRENAGPKAPSAVLDRWLVSGIGAGSSFVWTDPSQGLVAFVGRVGPFTRFAAVREGWEDALPALEASASRDAVDAATRAVLSISVEPRGPTAIIRGRLVDGTGARAIPDAVLVFQGDKILAVGPRGKVKIANGTRFMDAKGRTILPALWDFDARVGTFEDAALLLAQGVETAYVGGDLERAILVRNAAGPQSPAPIPSLKLVGQLSAGAPAPTCGGTCDALVLDGAADDEERAEAQKAGLPVFARVAAGAAAFDGLRAFVASSASSPDAVRDARKSGTPLVAGSAGSTLARAAEVLAASGLTPVQVVRALTSASARAAGEPDRTGTLAAGQRANMLLVEGDASRSIRALRKPAVVIVRGRAMNPDILKDRLGIK